MPNTEKYTAKSNDLNDPRKMYLESDIPVKEELFLNRLVKTELIRSDNKINIVSFK